MRKNTPSPRQRAGGFSYSDGLPVTAAGIAAQIASSAARNTEKPGIIPRLFRCMRSEGAERRFKAFIASGSVTP